MMPFSKKLISLLITLAFTGCVTTGDQKTPNAGLKNTVKSLPDSPLKDIVGGALEATEERSPEQERQLGHEMAAQLLGAKPLYKNDLAQKYVNQIGYWIAMQTESPQLAWRFGIIDTPNLNAFAAPGGYIFITRGLLLNIKSESELAGILAHEIGHVIKKHHVQAMKKQGLAKMLKGAAEAKTDIGKNPAISNLAKNLYTSGLDKADEYEADQVGVVLAARAGYSAYGLPSVLQMYATSSNDAALELLFATHPSPEDRLNKLDSLMAGRFDDLGDGLVNINRFEKVQKSIAYAGTGSTKKRK